MVRTSRARPYVGLAFLLACTFLGLVLVARSDGASLAFVSSPLSPLPSLPPRQAPVAAAVLPWPRLLGLGLITAGVVLVVVGLVWLVRPR
jgi:hypothetical protein